MTATDMQRAAGRVAGLSGALLVAVSLAGLVATQLTDVSPATAAMSPPAVTETSATVPEAPSEVIPAVAPEVVEDRPLADHYPLQVGRFWVYRYQEPGSDVVTEIERVIVRRESRDDGKELFIFDDDGVVYLEEGKVYEMGSSGGVNIIPVETAGGSPPVVYRSQGMQIEKWVGAADTSLVVAGQRFDDCLEVVTRFRALEDTGLKGPVSYSSFYAPGIGMVGRQTWPRDEQGSLAVILTDHGTRKL